MSYTGNASLTVGHPLLFYPASGQEGYWKFDDPFETASIDYTGNGHYAYLNGCRHIPFNQVDIQPPINFSNPETLSLNGTSDYVNFDPSFVPVAKSISFWVKLTGSSSQQNPIIYSGTDSFSTSTWNWGVWTSGTAFNAVGEIGGTPISVSPSGSIFSNWSHVYLNRDSTSGTSLYINGTLASTASSQTSVPTGPIQIGKAGSTYGKMYIDDVRIYNRNLTLLEIGILASGNDFPLQSYVSGSMPNRSGSSNLTATHPTFSATAHNIIPPAPNIYNGSALLEMRKFISSRATGTTAIIPYYKGMNLFMKQGTIPGQTTYNHPLFTSGSTNATCSSISNLMINGNFLNTTHKLNLFISNKIIGPSIQLFMIGASEVVSNSSKFFNLFIRAHTLAPLSSTTLFISQNSLGTNKKAPLFICQKNVIGTSINNRSLLYIFAGDGLCGMMNLFVKTPPINPIFNSLPFAMVSSVAKGNFSAAPLKIVGSGLGHSMNLVVKGKDSGGNVIIIGLVITGRNANKINAAPLYLYNSSNGIESPDMEFFIQGDGQNPGYFPKNESMNLYISRGPQAGSTLFMCNNQMSTSIPLTIIGAPSLSGNSSLFVGGYGGALNRTNPMIINGDVFKNSESQTILVIPKAIGFIPESAELYTNGFNY